MVCGSDSFYMHYVMTATAMRRESEKQELALKARVDILTDAMMLLIYAGKETITGKDRVDTMFLEYFERLTELVNESRP